MVGFGPGQLGSGVFEFKEGLYWYVIPLCLSLPICLASLLQALHMMEHAGVCRGLEGIALDGPRKQARLCQLAQCSACV